MNQAHSVQAESPASSRTIIEFLLDETGSMESCRMPTIGGFNEFVNEQRNQDGLCLLTLTKFDTRGLRTPYTDIDIKMVPHLTLETYAPNSGTNLYDAIGERIQALETRIKEQNWSEKPHILFVIMTDGQDNASRIYNPYSLKELIGAKEALGWTFVYLGANQDAWQVGQHFGMRQGNTKTYNTTQMASTMKGLSESTTKYRAFRASGLVSSEQASERFFATEDAHTIQTDTNVPRRRSRVRKSKGLGRAFRGGR